MSSDDPQDSDGLSIMDDGGAADEARRPKPRRRRGVLILIGVLAVFLIVPTAVVAIYANSVQNAFTENVQRKPSLTIPSEVESERPRKPAKGEKGAGSVNFLLMGSDSRGDGNGGRSDALMLLHLNAKRDKAYIISFPRDLYVDIPGHGKNKINAAYAFGGPALSARTIEELLDVRIDHLAQIDMTGFINLTTELGGVTVNNKHYSKSGGHEFPTGKITISGKEALSYVRERKQLPRGDLDRAERQRQVVRAIISKGLSREVISNPGQFTKFVGAAARNMTVDESLTDAEIRKLALGLRMTPSDVVTLEVPTKGTGTAGSMSIVVADDDGIATMATHVREDTLSDYNP